MKLTVVIRDEGPLRHLNEPCTYRTVQLDLTPAQVSALRRSAEEAISLVYLESESTPPPRGFIPVDPL